MKVMCVETKFMKVQSMEKSYLIYNLISSNFGSVLKFVLIEGELKNFNLLSNNWYVFKIGKIYLFIFLNTQHA